MEIERWVLDNPGAGCPLCGHNRTSYWSERGAGHEDFWVQRCRNQSCQLPCQLWPKIIDLQEGFVWPEVGTTIQVSRLPVLLRDFLSRAYPKLAAALRHCQANYQITNGKPRSMIGFVPKELLPAEVRRELQQTLMLENQGAIVIDTPDGLEAALMPRRW